MDALLGEWRSGRRRTRETRRDGRKEGKGNLGWKALDLDVDDGSGPQAARLLPLASRPACSKVGCSFSLSLGSLAENRKWDGNDLRPSFHQQIGEPGAHGIRTPHSSGTISGGRKWETHPPATCPVCPAPASLQNLEPRTPTGHWATTFHASLTDSTYVSIPYPRKDRRTFLSRRFICQTKIKTTAHVPHPALCARKQVDDQHTTKYE